MVGDGEREGKVRICTEFWREQSTDGRRERGKGKQRNLEKGRDFSTATLRDGAGCVGGAMTLFF